MKAFTYHGPHYISVDTMPDSALEALDSIVLRVTVTVIYGSDLHPYRGGIPGMYHDNIFGHEFMGEVMEVGSEATTVRRGDRVIIPFVIAYGDCFFCRLQQYTAYESTNSGRGAIFNRKDISPPAALSGYSDLYGGIPGGQAEYTRVPKANTGSLKVPDTLPDGKVLLLSNIPPTVWQAVRNAEVKPGGSVAISGAGPVGLLCASYARFNGAEQIFIIDYNDYRLDFAQQRCGTVPINFDTHDDPAQWIIGNMPGHRGVDAMIDVVGFEAKGSLTETVLSNLRIESSSGKALRQCTVAVRCDGVVSMPGVYAGFIHGFIFDDVFDRGLTFRTGQAHAHTQPPDLLMLTEQGLFTPEEIVTYHMPPEEAVRGYQIFERREEACHKIILAPGMQPGKAAS